MVIGWLVTLVFGVSSGGFIIPRLTAKRKIFAWKVNEVDLIPKQMSEMI
jgi:hypothetical protein